jgi:hypothetical protein
MPMATHQQLEEAMWCGRGPNHPGGVAPAIGHQATDLGHLSCHVVGAKPEPLYRCRPEVLTRREGHAVAVGEDPLLVRAESASA